MKKVLLLLLLVNFAFANNSFMLGAKTFTLDFKGYSGFMLELGGGTSIPVANDDLFFGLHSGFGYSSKNYSEGDIKMDASSTVLPIKAFFSYGLFGASIGTLLTFYDIKTKGNVAGVNLSNFDDKGTTVFFDFGIMVFPHETFSIGFDVITKSSSTGFALGIAYHFGKTKEQSYYEEYYVSEASCGSDPIYTVYVERDEDNIDICVELNSGKTKCLNLSERREFKNVSYEAIKDFERKSSFISWFYPPVDIRYSEFFIDGDCDE